MRISDWSSDGCSSDLGLLSARYSWDIPLARDAERGLYDIRLLETAARVPQDDRIVLAVYTDETLDALAKRSPLDREMLADALRKIDARSEEHTSELQSLMRTPSAVFCLQKKN